MTPMNPNEMAAMAEALRAKQAAPAEAEANPGAEPMCERCGMPCEKCMAEMQGGGGGMPMPMKGGQP